MMKIRKIYLIPAALLVAGFISATFAINKPSFNTNRPADSVKGFAVVEFFTSEGCSSCPAADAVIAKIEKEVKGKPVYILAYHVDYWNRLGWKDVFSSAGYSRRQNMYANWLNLQSVYTPQVIVNGQTEFVGSQEGTLRSAINANLKKNPETKLDVEVVKVKDNKAVLTYHVPEISNNTLVLALIKKEAKTVVKRGENSGRTLSHVQIVSNIQTVRLTTISGEADLSLPTDFSAGGFEVIVFVQNSSTGDITAATRAGFVGTY